MKKYIVTLRSLVQTIRQISYRYFARTLALLAVALFTVFVAGYFSQSNLDPADGSWARCGDFGALKQDATMFDQDVLALDIHHVPPAKFILSGRLSLSPATYIKHYKGAEGVLVELNRVSSSSVFHFNRSNWIAVEKPQGDAGDRRRITLNLRNYELAVDGNLLSFPLDDYRVGFAADVHVLRHGARSYRRQPVDVVIVNTDFSNALRVEKAQTVEQFLRNPDPLGRIDLYQRYSVDQCALVIKRPLWYQAMIAFLLVLMFVPAVYLFYKPETDPGVELIAAILGVAAVRAFVLDGFTPWNFYPIDIVFALAVLFTAVIPLRRLPMRKKSAATRTHKH